MKRAIFHEKWWFYLDIQSSLLVIMSRIIIRIFWPSYLPLSPYLTIWFFYLNPFLILLAWLPLLQCLDPLLQGRCYFLFRRSKGGKWRWSFHPFLLAENISRSFLFLIDRRSECSINCQNLNWSIMWCCFVDEWKNFLERVRCTSEEELRENPELEEELRLWASYRGQTLTRTGIWFLLWIFPTLFLHIIHSLSNHIIYLLLYHLLHFCLYLFTVRGMMYYRKALELQAFLDMAKDEGSLDVNCWLHDFLIHHFWKEMTSSITLFDVWCFLQILWKVTEQLRIMLEDLYGLNARL